MFNLNPPLGRQRFVNQVRKQVAAAAQAADGGDDSDDDLQYLPPIDPGQIQLYSYFAPGLETGSHTIEVNQVITAPHANGETKTLTTYQDFEVYGARFALPQNAIHQTYPPQGHEDYNYILPHIVLNDPHLPWEIIASSAESPTDQPPPRNVTPWLALFVFTENEIGLDSTEIGPVSKGGLFPDGFPDLIDKQSKTTMAVTMPTRQVLKLDNWKPGTPVPADRKIVTPIRDDDPDQPILPVPDLDLTKPANPETIDMVFVPNDLFNSFFCDYDTDGKRKLADQGIPLLTRYKYLAHTRQVNTQAMADAGIENEQGVFSVVVSHRAGPFPGIPRKIETPPQSNTPQNGTRPSLTLPKSVIVHLVSLQGIEKYVRLPVTESRVGLVSLASWTYTCLPLESVNFVDNMRAIGFEIPTQAYALRPPPSIIDAIAVKPTDPIASTVERFQGRLTDGYTIVNYLTHTGEKTAAFLRGAFCPTLPQHPLNAFWPGQVNFSSALQILDQDLGIMDITYAAAWELGRTLAVADKSFTASLSRIRRAAQVTSANDSKQAARGDFFRRRIDIANRLPDTVKFVSGLINRVRTGTCNPSLNPPSSESQDGPPHNQTSSNPNFESFVHATMNKLASGTSKIQTSSSTTQTQPYNEINIANNTDWALILKWIVDKMFLYNVPAHYLITDPSHLPQESIRFFYVDPNWIDALIDGALSIGNHLDESNDIVRVAMKVQLNKYFSTPIDSTLHPYHPQIPCYGFFLRSAVVKAFPNLQIHVPWSDPEDPNEKRTQILRNEVVDKDVLLCLLDRLPGADDLLTITISQPPHQQRFAVGTEFGPDPNDNVNTLKFAFKAVYTKQVEDPEYSEPVDIRTWKEGLGEILPSGEPPLNPPNPSWVFDWDNNCLIVPNFATACNNVLDQRMKNDDDFTDTVPSAALVGIQLNDPIKKLVINAPADENNKVPLEKDNYYEVSPQLFPKASTISAPNNPSPSSNTSLLNNPLSPSSTTGSSIRTSLPTGQAPKISAPLVTASRGQYRNATPKFPPSRKLTSNQPPRPSFAPAKNPFKSAGFISGNVGDQTFPLYPPESAKDLPVDIVFALDRSPLQDPTLKIWKIDVRIPRGTEGDQLFDAYTGTGAKMLSNQRFNVHRTGTQNYYYCTLVPRSTTQLVNLVDNPDCSFILNQVTLNRKEGKVQVEVFEYYKAPGPGSDPTKWPDTGLGRSTITLKKTKAAS